MDENEILSRLDARGGAAAAGVHAAVADGPVPAFDPEVVVVPSLDAPRPGRRRLAVAGIAAAVVVLAGAVALLVGGSDDDATPLVDSGSARRFAAGHLPEGFRVAGMSEPVTDETTSPWAPLVLFGPDPQHPELAAAVNLSEDAAGVGIEGAEVISVGGRTLSLLPSRGLSTHTGVLTGDGWSAYLVAAERATLESVAATGTIDFDGEGGRPVFSPRPLPDGWRELGRLRDIMATAGLASAVVSALPTADRWLVVYGTDPSVLLAVASEPGSEIDVAAGRLFSTAVEDVEVRGHPAVLTRIDADADADVGGTSWTVSWVERPGEVVRVGGLGVDRAEVLAVAEDLHVADDVEWRELERASLRGDLEAPDDEVVLGEGTFSDESPWLLVVHPDGYDDMPGPGGALPDPTQSGEGSVGIPPEGAAPPFEPAPVIEVRTRMTTVSGSASASSGGEEPLEAFDGGISVDWGETFGWAYGFLAPGVATVELVEPDGDVLDAARTSAAGGYIGFLLELPPELGIGAEDEHGSSTEASTTIIFGGDPATPVAPTTAGSAPPSDRPVLVARDGDGVELGRHELP